MRSQRRQGRRSSADTSLLRTCQVCSHAKLRCDRTQSSGSCDRCLRLQKTCIFPPARRGAAPAQRVNRISQLEAKIAKLDDILSSQQSQQLGSRGSTASPASDRGTSRSPSTEAGEAAKSSRSQPANGVSLDPFQLGLLSIETGDLLLDRFRRSLTPYFPFVIIPESSKVTDLHREKPIVCLAILFASSCDDGILQGRISRLFEQMLATALLQGRIASLENLQGLLIYTAWMQYQPRPRKHTQNIFLAMSIIYDMRFHKPRELPTREDNGLVFLTGGLRADEVRALVGLYCVASCASVILDKFRCFPTIPLLAESCEAMAQRAEHPTDPYLPQIVGLLRMIEDVDGLAKGTTPQQRDGTSAARISHLQYQWQSLKKSLPAHAATSPFLRFQTRAAQFLLGEMSLPGSPFSLSEDTSTSLAKTISAVKSLMDTLLSAEPDQELCFTNLAWVTLGYGLSLGVKLDILCTTCGISPATVIELRRSLDIAQTLRGLIERLRMSISQHKDTDAESHPLFQFLSRAEAVESWYARHGPPSAASDLAIFGNQHGLETVSGTMQETHRRDALPGHSHPTTEGEVSFGTTYNQDVEIAYDPEMLAFEGLDFEGMDFAMDPQEVWNPFVFPDGA